MIASDAPAMDAPALRGADGDFEQQHGGAGLRAEDQAGPRCQRCIGHAAAEKGRRIHGGRIGGDHVLR
ncbi:MAG: hypothetical protein ACKO54_26830 [Alphaproteobacteria bacterium]